METVVCIDRDGTIVYDDHYYLGKQDNWRELVELLPKVVEGLKVLEDLDTTEYMITNQSGVAVEDFDKLTEERAREVCLHIMDQLKKEGVPLVGYYLCPHVPPDYNKKHPERSLKNPKVCQCNCIKPNTGMVENVLNDAGIDREDAEIYVIGDRASDVKTALNSGGTGILVPFENQEGQKSKVEELNYDNTYIAEDFKDAARYIKEKEDMRSSKNAS